MKKLFLTFPLLFCIALITGCGPKRPEGLPNLVSCVLTIQFEDGSPVDNATVSLAPEDESLRQWSISGSTDASGTAKIYTNSEFAGVPAGKYKVAVRKVEVIPTNKKDEYDEPITDTRSLIAEKFTNPGQTPLILEVGGSPVNETYKVEK